MAGMDSGSSAITPSGGGSGAAAWSDVASEEGFGGANVEAPQKPPVQSVALGSTGNNLDPVRGN